jgi:hypothetical protein
MAILDALKSDPATLVSRMKRRTFFQSAAALPLAGVLDAAAAPSLETRIVRLNLQHTWTTTMSSSEYRDTLQVAYARDGISGHGEGAPIVRYKEDAAAAQRPSNPCANCCWGRRRWSSPRP